MQLVTVCFLGHREIDRFEQVSEWVEKVIDRLTVRMFASSMWNAKAAGHGKHYGMQSGNIKPLSISQKQKRPKRFRPSQSFLFMLFRTTYISIVDYLQS